MNHGFWSTTPRQNAKVGSGTLQTIPVPKKSENEQIQNQIDDRLYFDSQGIIHKEFVPPGQTINQTFYLEVLKDSGKGWHLCDQALHALGCCTTTMPHVTWQSPSMNF